jgi:hypothetical protein
MKKTMILLIWMGVSLSAAAQKGDSTDLTLPKFEVKDQNGHSQRFTHPRMKRFKGRLFLNGKARVEKVADSVVFAPVEVDPTPIMVPVPQQTITTPEAMSVGPVMPKLLVVVEYDKYIQLGSNVQNCVNYVSELFGKVQPAFDKVGLPKWGIKEVIVHTSPTLLTNLPSNTTTQTLYNEFGVMYCSRWDVDGKLLLTTRNVGGIASMGVLNNNADPNKRIWNVAVIGAPSQYLILLPTYNTVYSTTHELGHFYNGVHSFICNDFPDGSKKRLDSTYFENGSPCGTTTKRPFKPTSVLSYGQLYQALDTANTFHPVSAARMVAYWNAQKGVLPIDPAPACTTTVGPWGAYSGGYRTRLVTATPLNCRGIVPASIEKQPANPPCTYSLTLGPCINGFQTITPTAINSPCTGSYTGPTSQVCTVPVTNTFTISGTPYTGYSRADIAKAVDGNETTRFLTTGATTLTWTFSQPTTRTQVYLSSGFNGGSPNQTLTLTVDGVNVDLAFDKKIKFTKAINATGKRFVLTTTGTGNISRIFEVSLK